MNVHITFGIGSGPTNLSAFDAALFDAGIGNFNIIRLSSVIPPDSDIILGRLNWTHKWIGQKLYAVLSHSIIDKLGSTSSVGLGWLSEREKGGILVEYNSPSRENTIAYINKTLNAMAKYRSINSEPIIKTLEINCTKDPTCALIAAVFEVQKWD